MPCLPVPNSCLSVSLSTRAERLSRDLPSSQSFPAATSDWFALSFHLDLYFLCGFVGDDESKFGQREIISIRDKSLLYQNHSFCCKQTPFLARVYILGAEDKVERDANRKGWSQTERSRELRNTNPLYI